MKKVRPLIKAEGLGCRYIKPCNRSVGNTTGLFVAVGADVGLLARNADALAKKFKSG